MSVESYEFWKYQPKHPLWKLVKFQSRSICPRACSWCCIFNCSLCCLNCNRPFWKEPLKTNRLMSRTAWFVDTLLSPEQLRLGGLIHSVNARKWKAFFFLRHILVRIEFNPTFLNPTGKVVGTASAPVFPIPQK